MAMSLMANLMTKTMILMVILMITKMIVMSILMIKTMILMSTPMQMKTLTLNSTLPDQASSFSRSYLLEQKNVSSEKDG